MPLSHLPPSYRAHWSLMLCGGVAAACIIFFLVVGWRWHFTEIARRQELARLSALADQRYSEMASQKAVTLLGAVPGGLMKGSRGGGRPVSAVANAHVRLADLANHQDDAGLFPVPVPIVEDVTPLRLAEALESLHRFTQAASWQQKLPFVADAERVKPLMISYYETQKNTDPESGVASQSAHFRLNNTEVLLFSYPSSRPGGRHDLAMIAPTRGGSFVVDWESFVGASDMSWQDFKKQRPVEPKLFRVFARRDDYFNYEFSDASRYLSLHFTSPDGLHFIFGYCEKDSVVGKTLSILLDKTGVRLPLTLRLAYPENAQSDHCVKIVGVVANRWLIVK